VRILLAGVPFGCDNVGDEAILECALEIFRSAAPGAAITVSTGDPERTASRLGVETCGLLGFFGDVSPAETREIIGAHDCFVWCGATGLSDYPQVTTELMLIAQSLGKMTILWGVGMNDELTPSFHKVLPGRRRTVLGWLGRATLGLVDAIALEERRRNKRSRGRIRQCLNAADLIVVRDGRSRDEVLKCGVTREVIVGADSAILLEAEDLDGIALAPGVRDLLKSEVPKIGLCISAQGRMAQERELASVLDGAVAELGGMVVAIPMNPKTDAALMAGFAAHLRNRDRIVVLTGEYQPAEILAVAARMDVVVSSRLHLLILAAAAGVPIVGVARGSKVNNFLEPFGLSAPGSVERCDFDALGREVTRLLGSDAGAYAACNARVMAELRQRLDDARQSLAATLSGP